MPACRNGLETSRAFEGGELFPVALEHHYVLNQAGVQADFVTLVGISGYAHRAADSAVSGDVLA
jgi:hypothetical protein